MPYRSSLLQQYCCPRRAARYVSEAFNTILQQAYNKDHADIVVASQTSKSHSAQSDEDSQDQEKCSDAIFGPMLGDGVSFRHSIRSVKYEVLRSYLEHI